MNALLIEMKRELLQEMPRVLQYWENVSWDPEREIFLTLGCDNLPLQSGYRSSVLISRVLWAYSSAYLMTGQEHDLEMAAKAYHDLTSHYLDEEHGGIYEGLNADGSVRDPQKRIYTQSYLIYAMSEYYRASRDLEALSIALNTFEKTEASAFDPQIGGYIAGCSREWKPLNGLLELDTYLHLMESYTNLYKAYPDQYLKSRLQMIVILLLSKWMRNGNSLYQQLNTDFSPTADLSDRFADEAECAWMLLEARDVIADSSMDPLMTDAAVNMMQHLVLEGVDREHGGVYDRKCSDADMSTDKLWWEESESVTGLLYAYRESRDETLLNAAADTWEFMKKYIISADNEWQWMVRADGTPVASDHPEDPLKCPYHSTRIAVLCVSLIEQLAAEG